MDFGSPRIGLRSLDVFSSTPQDKDYGAPTTTGGLSVNNSSMHGSSPRGVLQDGPEVARRAAEWERQIESLDQKEMEIHQTQLRLIREQTTTFRGDLLALQQELVDLKAMVSKHSALHRDLASGVDGRLASSERTLKEFGESVGKHALLHQDADRKLAQITGSMADHHRALAHHATLKERVDYVERILGDSADKHQRQLEEAHSKLDQLHGRLSACESGHSDLKKGHADKDQKHATMSDRVAYLEKLMGDSAEKHSRDLEAFRQHHDKHMKDTQARNSAVEQAHASVASRLNFLEAMVGDSADKHAKELEAVKATMGKLGGGLQSHASVAERLSFIEAQMGDSADKHAAELSAAHSKIDRMGGHAEVLEGLKKGHAGFAKDIAALSSEHASWGERVAYLEKVVGDSADKHMREIDTIKAAHNKLAADSRAHGQNHTVVSERMEQVMKTHGTVQDRIMYIEKMLGDSFDKHAKELATLKAAHNGHSNAQKDTMIKHASMEDRLEYIEKAIGDSADKHAAALAAQQAKLEHLHGKLQDEQKERIKHGGDLTSHKDATDAHHSAMDERLAYLEKAIGDSADKHRRELEQVKGAHARLAGEGKDVRSKHASLEERLMYIENWFKGFKLP